jgi:hypothetical protein
VTVLPVARMIKAATRKPTAAAQTRSDLVTTINSNSPVRARPLSTASRPSAEEAPARQSAEAAAVTECRVDDEQRKRLVVRERD